MGDELLVHISTPATRQNDELFRALANAYTKFEPHRIHRDKPVRKRAKLDQAARTQPKISSTKAWAGVIGETAGPSVLTASKESYGSFPSNLSADERHLDQDVVSGIYESVRPISRLAQLEQSYLNWRKCATPRSSIKRSQGELQTSSDGPDADTGFIEDSQSALQALQSQLQDTYSTTSADTSDDDVKQHEDGAKFHSRSPPKSSPVQTQHIRTAEDMPLPDPVEDPYQTDMGVSSLQERTGPSIHVNPMLRNDFGTIEDEVDFSKLPIDAFPPPPTISIVRPKALPSQITKYLAAIKTKNPTRFRPLKIRRDLENDERGFWRIDCTRWSSNAQRDFWLSLIEHVCSGRIGWGTTLHREIESQNELGLVRLYCWGEVVEHMWLLLWLCSKGKASGSGSKWIDGNGVAVVEVD